MEFASEKKFNYPTVTEMGGSQKGSDEKHTKSQSHIPYSLEGQEDKFYSHWTGFGSAKWGNSNQMVQHQCGCFSTGITKTRL